MTSRNHRQQLKEPLTIKLAAYRGPLMTHDQYNQFFQPNLCHVCKSRGNGNLISCTDCNTISYCNEDHRKKHYEESHGKICKIIDRILVTTPHSFGETNCEMKEWIEYRERLLKKISLKIKQDLNRSIEEYEKQMVLWSKMCVFCYERKNLQSCQRCLSVHFCPLHREEFLEKHSYDDCTNYVTILNFEIARISRNCDVRYDELFSHPILLTPKDDEPCNIKTVLSKNLLTLESNNYLKFEDYILSDYISRPLTIYFGLERTNLLSKVLAIKRQFIIHIIDVDSVDRNSMRAWEILFHLSYKLHEIVIVCTGPGLADFSEEIIICNLCKLGRKKLTFICRPKLYDDYMQSIYNYKEPDIIIALGENSFEWQPYSNTVNAIKSRICPLFLSCSDTRKSEDIRYKIKHEIGNGEKALSIYKNPFASLLLYKDKYTNIVSFRNRYVVIFSNL